MTDNAVQIEPYNCPYCDYQMDAATNTTGTRGPSDGDFSICIKCGEMCVFTADVKLRKPTRSELLTIATDERFRKLRMAWTHVTARRN